MATISNTPRPGYIWDATDNVWYPIGVGAHQHTNAADTPAVMPYSTYAAAGKNKIINGDMSVWQRGTTFNSIANGSFAADRWQVAWDSSPTVNVTQQTFTPGTAPETGYESAYFLRVAETAVSSSTVLDVRYRIEDVRTFAGQTATLSFWAKADSTRTLSIATINQDFGTGGSTAVGVTPTTSSFSLTTSWQRFTTTMTFPSIAGKTIGTNNLVSVFLRNTASSSLVFDLWGVQWEAGSTATAFQTATGNPASELAACQRYFWRYAPSISTNTTFASGLAISSTRAIVPVRYPVVMRGTPSLAWSGTTGHFRIMYGGYSTADVTSVSLNSGGNQAFELDLGVASGLTTGNAVLAGTANSSAYVDLSAEL